MIDKYRNRILQGDCREIKYINILTLMIKFTKLLLSAENGFLICSDNNKTVSSASLNKFILGRPEQAVFFIIGNGMKLYWNKEWLYMQYHILDKSAKQIANENNCKQNNILYFLNKLNIPRKSMKEIRKRKYWGLKGKTNGMYNRKGKLNPNWKGGITQDRQLLYSSFKWKNIVKRVWKRDNATCQKCNKPKLINKIDYCIHHIESFSNKNLRYNINNLVLLCRNCHSFIHSKRNINMEFLKGGDA